MQRFELVEGSSKKFWEVDVEGKALTVRFGRIGTSGQVQTKTFGSPADATAAKAKLIVEKTKKGYSPVVAGKAPAATKAAKTADEPKGKESKEKKAKPAPKAAAADLTTDERAPAAAPKTLADYSEPVNREQDGLPHGLWVWTHASGQIAQEAVFARGVFSGAIRRFREDGSLESECEMVPDEPVADPPLPPSTIYGSYHTNGASRSTRGSARYKSYRSYHPNGVLEDVQQYDERGLLSGARRCYDENGALTLEEHYEEGLLHGPRRSVDEGRTTTETYDRGVPVLADKKRDALVARLQKQRDEYKASEMLEEATAGDGKALLWRLVTTGAYDLSKGPDVLSLIEEAGRFGTAEEVITLIQLRGPKRDWDSLIPGWPGAFDRLACEHYAKDPAPFERALGKVRGAASDGLALVRRRFGAVKASAVPKRALEQLALHVVSEDARDVPIVEDGTLVRVDACKPDGAMRLLAAFFDDRMAAKRALLAAALTSENISPWVVQEVASIANEKELAKLIGRGWLGTSRSVHLRALYGALLQERSDSAATLAKLASAVDEGWKSEVVSLAASIRAAERNEKAPAGIEERIELISFQYSHSTGEVLFEGRKELARGIAALGPKRARALLESTLTHPEYPRLQPIAALAGGYVDDELIEAAFRLTIEKAGKRDASTYGLTPAAHGLGHLAAENRGVLERLAREHDSAAPMGLVAETFRLAIVVAIGELGARGEEPPADFDRFLHFGGYAPGSGANYETYFRPYIEAAVRALPPARGAEAIRRSLDPKLPSFRRALAMLPSFPDPSLLAHAFAAVAACPQGEAAYYSETRGFLEEALKKLGEAAHPAVRALLGKTTNEGVHLDVKRALGAPTYERLKAEAGGKMVEEEPARPEPAARVLTRLAASCPGERTPIYVLEKGDGELGVACAGGAPVPKARVPKYRGEPMEHLITLDLEQMPELRERAPSLATARAVALFISSRRSNEAHTPDTDETKLVPLTEADLQARPRAGGAAVPLLVTRVDVPKGIFDPRLERSDDELEEDDDLDESEQTEAAAKERSALRALRGKVYALGGRALGEPLWLQSEDHTGSFLFQLDASIVDVNLGDEGILYAFDDTAFWQCH